MKYTKDDLAKMSDAEINQTLTAIYMGEPWSTHGELVQGGSAFHLADPLGNPFYLNVSSYCSDWSAIMPLAVEQGVTLKRVACPAGSGFAHYAESYCGVYHTDYTEPPQRAIACCLILVLQERK